MTKPFIYLAPLQGLTDRVYRNTFAAHFDGVDAAVTPFVSAVSRPVVPKRLVRELEPVKNRSWPLVPQMMGNDPRALARLGLHLLHMGYDALNWNLGCPFPMITKKHRGSGLLPDPDRIDRILDVVMPQLSGRLSVKIRLGRFEATEVRKLVPVFNRYPLTEIIVHPRTGVQRYAGRVDLNGFAECVNDFTRPLVYNGDICTVSDFNWVADRFPSIRRWMLGRGVLADPFLPSAIKGDRPTVDRRMERLAQFHSDLVAAYERRLSGPGHLCDRLKGHWRYLAQPFVQGRNVLKAIQRVRRMDRYWSVVDAFFSSKPQWRSDADRSGLSVGKEEP